MVLFEHNADVTWGCGGQGLAVTSRNEDTACSVLLSKSGGTLEGMRPGLKAGVGRTGDTGAWSRVRAQRSGLHYAYQDTQQEYALKGLHVRSKGPLLSVEQITLCPRERLSRTGG